LQHLAHKDVFRRAVAFTVLEEGQFGQASSVPVKVDEITVNATALGGTFLAPDPFC
jgi:hypothetical protein